MIRQTHIRFDWALKNILRQKANFGILEGFLSELLGDDVKIEEILESESNRNHEADKSNQVDILARTSNNELVIIEIQNTTEYDYFQRILFGTSKAITEFVDKGTPYSLVKKIISISIVYFDLGEGDDYVYKGHTEFIGLHTHHKLKLSEKQKKLFGGETPTDLFPTYYVIKTRNFKDEPKDTLDEWIYFLKNSAIEMDFKARGIKEANQKLIEANLRGKEYREYEVFLKNLRYQASMAQTHYFDTTWEVEQATIRAREEAQKEINAALMLVENAIHKAEMEKQKAEMEKQKAEMERQKNESLIHELANLETKQTIQLIQKNIRKGLDDQTIADFFDISPELVAQTRQEMDDMA